MPAAVASECAGQQGKFWEMHDKIFENQKQMSPEMYLEYAAELGLDVEQFKKDLVSAEVKSRIDADKKDAAEVGNTGTPGFFVNGKFLRGAKPFEAFKEIIDKELGEKKTTQRSSPAASCCWARSVGAENPGSHFETRGGSAAASPASKWAHSGPSWGIAEQPAVVWEIRISRSSNSAAVA